MSRSHPVPGLCTCYGLPQWLLRKASAVILRRHATSAQTLETRAFNAVVMDNRATGAAILGVPVFVRRAHIVAVLWSYRGVPLAL